MDDMEINLMQKYPSLEKSIRLCSSDLYDIHELPEWLQLMNKKNECLQSCLS